MKKNELIKRLLSIKGNPDIFLWNGVVWDYQDISDVSEYELTKRTFKDYLNRLEAEEIRDGTRQRGQEFNETELIDAKKWYTRQEKYEINPYMKQSDIDKGYFKVKKAFFIAPKKKNETSFGRGGDIEY